MGMYDNLRCEYQLPDPQYQNLQFQTKFGWCELGIYTIRDDGTLWYRGGYRHEGEGEGPDLPVGDAHGDIRFYDSVSTCPQCVSGKHRWRERGCASVWVEYEARFTDGKLTRITRISPEAAETCISPLRPVKAALP